jgi:hypothetical protein
MAVGKCGGGVGIVALTRSFYRIWRAIDDVHPPRIN